ncbi:MAG: bifunctional diaminohydroxyphosphoribosylaminopyrimidine [Bacteroidota bacterium]|jgi:diaminohydroxyphosphoribosylaminopyrimidine deaminase / 5-amino-6-(5-phosphoribosylamino)uracil reductase
MAAPEQYMQRCLQLALLGAGTVAPNPMVGAVLVYNDTIIGEGWHQQYGQAHAEVNCLHSVTDNNRALINKSTLYVSLEPCAHFGKTPPCTDLIIANKIPTVVIACTDQNIQVNGKGISRLKAAGINVITGVLENEAMALNRRFFTFNTQARPYIILKWAQSSDAKIAGAVNTARLHISNNVSNRLVHQWRSQEAAIMVGTNTALYDNPSLTTRLWPGKNPARILLDSNLRIAAAHQLLDDAAPTIVFNSKKEGQEGNINFCKIAFDQTMLPTLLAKLHTLNIQSVLVEGGARLLQSFIDAGYWDEARVIVNTTLVVGEGVAAPVLKNYRTAGTQHLLTDTIYNYQPL